VEQKFSPYRIIITGHAGHDGSLRYTKDGQPVTSFSVAVNARAKNRETGRWEPIPDPQKPERAYTRWFDITVWGECPTICKGDEVHVTARVKYEAYHDRNTGELRVSEKFDAESVQVLPRYEGNQQPQPAARNEYDIGDLGPPLDMDGPLSPGD
jgi:single stranded DNA-binding protein